MKIDNRWWIVLLVLAIVPEVHAEPAQEDPPNIVLIVADDLGYGDLSSYGADDLRTPHIDGLVEDGMHLTQFYANSPVCSPTRASILSGKYPDVAGVPGVIRTHARNSWGWLDPGLKLLPSVLQGAGYHTGMVGKWHLGLTSPNTPTERGFAYFKGYLGDMMDDYYTHRRHGINYMREGRHVIDPEGHATELFTKWAREYIRERTKSEAPFFLYLAYNAPHAPIQPPEEWLERVRQREPDVSERRAKMIALIEHLDDGVGRVVETLKETGAYEDNTLVVFTSDNGGATWLGATNGPLRGAKQDMYEGGIRVPMAAVWPGRIEAGSELSHPAMTADLYPTFAEAAGAHIDHYLNGRSLLPMLEGEAPPETERPFFFVRREGGRRYMGKSAYAIRRGDWKLLQNRPMEPFQLFNLAEDPREQNDLANERPEMYHELAELLRRHIQAAGEVPWQEPTD